MYFTTTNLGKYHKKIPQPSLLKIKQLERNLSLGDCPYKHGGIRLKKAHHLIRFRIGRSWRAIYQLNQNRLKLVHIVSRQRFDSFLNCYLKAN